MNLDLLLQTEVQEAVHSIFGRQPENLLIEPTNQEYEGSHTVICFGLLRISKKSPEQTAQLLGEYLVANGNFVSKFNVVKGFLNLVLSNEIWLSVFNFMVREKQFGISPLCNKEIVVEFSSPNTNKPLHLGHLRNNFLGFSVVQLFKAMGYRVHAVQIINDRGIHICKSMVAWMMFGNGETPQIANIKGDHLVGKYYVLFDKKYKEQINQLISDGMTKETAEIEAPIMKQAVSLLRRWESKDEEVVSLWQTMNQWVYDGFNVSYKRMGVEFEKLYFESDTYLLGRDEVLKGLKRGVFYQKADGSVWVDLSEDGLDHKLLLRADGTSVYMTQDIGTAILRFRDFPNIGGQVYTVGNEQEYHFKVLFLILKKLGYAWAEKCYHLSYGMVDLPDGRMKSREGVVVDADDLMQGIVADAKVQAVELGSSDTGNPDELNTLAENIGLGALKFFLLKVDPKKRILFNHTESIRLQGQTGPFIQYTHARISALIRKAEERGIKYAKTTIISNIETELELEIITLLYRFPLVVREATFSFSPSLIANFAFNLAKAYNKFYQTIPVLNEKASALVSFRLSLSKLTSEVLKNSLALLGIRSPEKM